MSENNKIEPAPKFFYETIIEISDKSNDFIPYWNLALEQSLYKIHITLGEGATKKTLPSLTSFNIKLVDKSENYSPDNGDIIKLDKFLTMDIYRIKKEKEVTNDFKQNF